MANELKPFSVKPLVWWEWAGVPHNHYVPHRSGYIAETSVCIYRIFPFDEGWAWWWNADTRNGYLESEAAAMAAAQADYERRILSAIELSPVGDQDHAK